jgi:hypothetical protein
MTTTTKISLLPELTTPTANASNTAFVVVDKSSGTFTTKQLSLQNLDLFVDNIGPVAFAQANGAFNKANSANVIAQGAYDKANSANVIAQGAYDKANSANVIAQAAFDKANTDTTFITITSGTHGNATFVPVITVAANGRISAISNIAIGGFANATYATSSFDHANASFNKANSANVLAQQAFDAANIANSGIVSTAYAQSNAAFDKANSANVLAQAAFDKANTDNTFITVVNTGSHGNSIFVPVITVAANGRITTISNTAITGFANATYDQAGFDKANSANVLAQAAFNQANTGNTTANSANVSALAAFDKANSANVLAQNAYNYANTISITLNDTFINASRNTANAAFVQANAAYNAANTAVSTASLSWLTANNSQVTANAANTVAQAAFTQANIATPAFAQANTANTNAINAGTYANAAFSKANSANVLAQQAFDQANTAVSGYNQANTATTIAQSSYNFANTVNTYAYSAYATANTNASIATSIFTKTNSAFDTANTALVLAGQAISYDNQADGAFIKANAAFDQANTATTTGTNAYAQANTAQNTATAAFNTANNANTRTIINGLGVSKLDFATFGANTAYLATTSDDSTALFMGAATAEIYAYTSIQIRANTGGTSKAWTFGDDGTVTFPDSTIQNTAFTSTPTLTTLNVSGNTTVGNLIISTGGKITGDAAAGNVSANAVGYMGMPQNNLTSNYVITLADQGRHLYYNVSTSSILYIPTTSNVAFPVGATIDIISRTSSSANVTITPNTGVSLFLAGNTTSAGRNVTTYGVATLVCVAANTWFVSGTGVSAL